jgi:inorganic triphosphatase YgiF
LTQGKPDKPRLRLMKSDPRQRQHSEEIELKLALPSADSSSLAKRLSKIPLLARRKPAHQSLYNVYYDTPDQFLRQKRVALRIRRTGTELKPQWLQTLKMGGQDYSALSQRGEWEASLADATLSWDVLNATPWSLIDPDGAVFQALEPCFVTSFERTCWTVHRRDRSVIEIALDIGQIVTGDKSASICELELELLAGQPQALFAIAQELASHIAVLPLAMSKAARGYALGQASLDTPVRGQPPLLTPDLPLPLAARQLLQEMFCQFLANLNALRSSDDPEVVHQARIGWRRFKSTGRLFRSALVVQEPPSLQPLEPLMAFMGELRDLDVARTETLPPLAASYTGGDARRTAEWEELVLAMLDAANIHRKAVRYALEEPAVGQSLLATLQWLEELSAGNEKKDAQKQREHLPCGKPTIQPGNIACAFFPSASVTALKPCARCCRKEVPGAGICKQPICSRSSGVPAISCKRASWQPNSGLTGDWWRSCAASPPDINTSVNDFRSAIGLDVASSMETI